MYKSQKDIDDWIKAFNKGQLKRMKEDKYEGYEEESERFRGGGEWAVELTVPQAILDLLPEWESENWWEIPVVIDDDGEGVFEEKKRH